MPAHKQKRVKIMSYLLITGSATNQYIKEIIEEWEGPVVTDPDYCGYAKSLLNGHFYADTATTITEKVCKTFEIVSVNVQRALREVKTNSPSNHANEFIEIAVGVGAVGLSLYSSYRCIKEVLNRDTASALKFGGFSLASLIFCSYFIYDGVLKISLSPFCKK